MSFVDEQPGECTHKHHKGGRTNHARKDSPEHNITDMMMLSLAWSDPQMSDKEIRERRLSPKTYKDREFSKKMAVYFKKKQPSDNYSDVSDCDDEDDES